MAGAPRSHLWIDVRPGERLDLTNEISVEVVHKSGRAVRLLVLAPKDIGITKAGNKPTDEWLREGAPVEPSM